mmetsp:Transcript_2418/g.4782  ORF Transcript_2418/g.4782 Transcript_2418/m.4782 type:complete len:216 (-) Transcript_2418:237-884(-)
MLHSMYDMTDSLLRSPGVHHAYSVSWVSRVFFLTRRRCCCCGRLHSVIVGVSVSVVLFIDGRSRQLLLYKRILFFSAVCLLCVVIMYFFPQDDMITIGYEKARVDWGRVLLGKLRFLLHIVGVQVTNPVFIRGSILRFVVSVFLNKAHQMVPHSGPTGRLGLSTDGQSCGFFACVSIDLIQMVGQFLITLQVVNPTSNVNFLQGIADGRETPAHA